MDGCRQTVCTLFPSHSLLLLLSSSVFLLRLNLRLHKQEPLDALVANAGCSTTNYLDPLQEDLAVGDRMPKITWTLKSLTLAYDRYTRTSSRSPSSNISYF